MDRWQNKRVAITGATGFVGYHLARQLHERGADVRAIVRATSNIQPLRALGIPCRQAALQESEALAQAVEGCDYLFHVAGVVGFTPDWDLYRRANVEATRSVLWAARLARVRRVIHTSSIVAVGASERPIALDECAKWNLGEKCVPYVTSKREAEEAALGENGRGLEVIAVNPASVIGPDDYTQSEFGLMCKRFWRGHLPIHFGGGNNFVDVRDVATGHILAAEHGRPGDRYLLAGDNITMPQFFWDLCKAARRSIPRVRLPLAFAPWLGAFLDRVQGKRNKRPYLSAAQAALVGLYFFYDSSKARRELGFHARPLRETLADTYRYWTSSGSGQKLSA